MHFLLEIGTEEIPAAELDSAIEQLCAAFVELKQKQNLPFAEENLQVMGTPRRLAVLIADFPAKQADIESKKVKGPPAGVAFKNGKPTLAATGFAKAQGVKVEYLKVEPTDRGDYLFAVSTKAGQPSQKVLAENLGKVIDSLNFNKAMRWKDSARFIRPIRWLVAMLGSKVINFSYVGLKASKTTYGHRLLDPKGLVIDDASNYQKIMQQAKVVVEPQKRVNIIEAAAKKIKQGYVDLENARIQKTFCEVVNLVESPSTLVGNFDEKFLKLPSKVVETVLQSHQRYLPILKERSLTNNFLVVHNGDPKKEKLIKHGHEKVVRARLEDAAFYIAEDAYKKLSSRVKDLNGIIFHRQLGTLLDKTKRLEFLVKNLASGLAFTKEETKAASRAAHLAKADLLTSMVGEFDELQGFIGAEYASMEGESKKVATAIYEQYLPRSTKDSLPKSKAGSVLSIADRIDTLCAYISIGILPTSAGDPYALRRQSTGLVQVIFEGSYDLSISELTKIAYRKLAKDYKNLRKESVVIDDVTKLVNQRIEFLLSQKGIDYDIIRAVAGLNIERPIEFKDRAFALQNIRNTASQALQDLVTVYNRASSIAESKLGLEIKDALLIEPAEKDFSRQLKETEKKLDEAVSKKDYKKALKLLAETKIVIDKFFDDVLVMAKEKDLRKNRHALLNRFVAACLKVADLSKIEKSN